MGEKKLEEINKELNKFSSEMDYLNNTQKTFIDKKTGEIHKVSGMEMEVTWMMIKWSPVLVGVIYGLIKLKDYFLGS